MADSKPSAVPSKSAPSISEDPRYTFDAVKLEELRNKSPWKEDPNYFKKVAVSPCAIMKMMMHCQSGVDKGIKKGGNPIEVMGLVLGRPDPDTPHTLVVTDAFPLPIEGFETRVIADDSNVTNHMIALGESLEETRKEKFMGWYHSHPFDLAESSHCFLSQTDLTTQLQWQRMEDPHGNPFVAMVIDPLRSNHRHCPEIKAFRAYPPDHSPRENQCPDGSVIHEEAARLELWGSCWNRYYALDVQFFLSNIARHVLRSLTQDSLWMRKFQSGISNEDRQRKPGKIQVASRKIRTVDVASTGGGNVTASMLHGRVEAPTKNQNIELDRSCEEVVELATNDLQRSLIQKVKQQIFS